MEVKGGGGGGGGLRPGGGGGGGGGGGAGGGGFISTERVKTQKPKHYTRWGGVGGKGCFLKTTQILLLKFPCTTVKKKNA